MNTRNIFLISLALLSQGARAEYAWEIPIESEASLMGGSAVKGNRLEAGEIVAKNLALVASNAAKKQILLQDLQNMSDKWAKTVADARKTVIDEIVQKKLNEGAFKEQSHQAEIQLREQTEQDIKNKIAEFETALRKDAEQDLSKKLMESLNVLREKLTQDVIIQEAKTINAKANVILSTLLMGLKNEIKNLVK